MTGIYALLTVCISLIFTLTDTIRIHIPFMTTTSIYPPGTFSS